MVSLGRESVRFASAVLDRLELTRLVQVTVFALDVSVDVACLYLEGSIGRLVTERVGSVVVDFVDLFQDGHRRRRFRCVLFVLLLAVHVRDHHHYKQKLNTK